MSPACPFLGVTETEAEASPLPALFTALSLIVWVVQAVRPEIFTGLADCAGDRAVQLEPSFVVYS